MPRRMPHALVLAAAATWGAAQGTAQREAPVDFAREVLPILSDRCFSCHGPDAKARKADLRLDQPGALATRSREFLARITSTDDDERMPPPDSRLSLSPAEVQTLRRWLDAGAPWATHWAFVPPRAPEPPGVVDAAWCRNPIDRFVLHRLQQERLRPAPAAEPGELLRRVSLDLCGLPPTPEAIAAFAADGGDAAYARAVEQLLASPHYGERMAWPWLQAARYADTDGYQADPTRTMWPWRDWLIGALNDNVPFDHLTVQMLAGDLLPEATPEQVLASGFHRNHAYNGEGGRIAEETRVENVFDRVETTATVWLGLTMECARCHDHKYDPIAQRDYYRMFAFFDQTSETGAGGTNGRAAPNVRYLTPAMRRQQDELRDRAAALARQMEAPDAELDARQRDWLLLTQAMLRARYPMAHAVPPLRLSPWRRRGPEAVLDQPTGMCNRTDGWNPDPALRDGAVHDLPETVGATYLHRVITAPDERALQVSLGSDDALRVWCNGELLLTRDVRRGAAPDQDFVRLTLRAGDNDLLLEVVNTGGKGGFYFDPRDEVLQGPPGIGDLPVAIASAALLPQAQRDDAALRRHFRNGFSARYREHEAEVRNLRERLAQIDAEAPVVMVMDTLPASRRRTTHVLERGGYDQPRAEVQAGTPAFLPPLPEGPADRLLLARWLVAPDHPLTARVAVNRAWQTFFGRGLVATPEDFGRQGSAPSHPELLDWLATWYVASGWDTKALHRLIVDSATYRQSAHAPRAAYEQDPDNVRLARGPRFRMPSWMLRDQALQLSGLLVDGLGGPPVRPWQPDGVWAEATFDQIRYTRDRGENLYRRSVYVFWRRIVGPTSFFDEPGRQTCVVRPSRTNTPLHALATWNDTTYVEAARGFATRAWHAGENPAARIAWAFTAATARAPDAEELAVLTARFAAARTRCAATAADAAALLAVGEAATDPTIGTADLAAMTVVCSILWNLDEVLCKP